MEGNKMKRSFKLITSIALIAALLMAGCSSNSRSSDRRSSRDMELDTAVPVETAAAYENSSRGFTTADAEYMSGEVAYADEYSSDYYDPGTGYPDSNGSSVTVEPGAAESERMLIRYVTMSCETLHFAELTGNIEAQVAALGGYIESKNFSGTGNAGDLRTASYTIRLTSDALDQLTGIIGSSAVILSSNESTEDVTLTYADTQARIESLRIEQETLNNLLAQADDLDIILQLQNELTYIRYEIESYESQLRVLENLSSYSTLTLYVSEVIEETTPEEPHVKTFSEKLSESFHDGLEDAKENWEEFVINAAGSIIPISVTIVLIVIAVIILRIVIKKIKRKFNNKNEAAPVKAEGSKEGSEKKD